MLSKYPISLISLVCCCCVVVMGSEVPQLMLSSTSDFLNWELAKNGETIEKFLDNATIPDIAYDDKFEGVHVKMNLTNITQKIGVHWQGNVFNVDDAHSFTILSKNINLTLNGHIQFQISNAVKQRGTLVIQLQKLEADTSIKLSQPPCQYQGLGFNVQISQLFIHTDNMTIKIEGKGIDNFIIRLVMSVLKSRLPGILQNVAMTKVNPMLSKYTCSNIEEQIKVGSGNYIVKVNTTTVPYFKQKNLYFVVDLIISNQLTNQTNPEVEDDVIPYDNTFIGVSNVTVAFTSNSLNTIIWLIDNSKILSRNITQKDLGPNPPIDLNTQALSILLPGLTKYGKRDVILLVETSSKFSHLYLRNGKILAVVSLSVKFVVNMTASPDQDVQACLATHDCVMASDLNITLPVSLAAHVDSGSLLKGLLHSLSVEDVKVISSEIEVNTKVFSQIVNSIIGSIRPQINSMLNDGIPIDLSIVEKFGVQDLVMHIKKDHSSLGMLVL